MATHLEIADFLYHISKHPEDFEVEEVTEILKEAADIICAYAEAPANKFRSELEDIDPSKIN